MIEDALLILFISFCTASVSEGVLYLLVYQTDHYKRLKSTIEKQSKRLERKKETVVDSVIRPSGSKKRLEKQEEQLKVNSRDLTMVKMKSMFAIGLTFTALLGMFNTMFDGRVVAKLPFEPFSLLRGISHRNLMGSDATDCSFIFLYILCTMSIRENVQKLLGFGPSRTANKVGGGFQPPK